MTIIRAEITDVDDSGDRPMYEWEERAAAFADGSDYAPPAFRRGTFDTAPAVEINDNPVAVGTLVWLRERGYVAGQMWYEFAHPSAGAVFGAATASSPPAITSDVTWTDTGVSISIPSAGTYELTWVAHSVGQCNKVGEGIFTRLYDVTNTRAVPPLPGTNELWVCPCVSQVVSVVFQGTGTGVCHATFTGAATVRLECYRTASASPVTWAQSYIAGGSVLAPRVMYKKLS